MVFLTSVLMSEELRFESKGILIETVPGRQVPPWTTEPNMLLQHTVLGALIGTQRSDSPTKIP